MSRSNAREITAFSKREITSLFKKARTVTKKMGLDIRLAPKSLELAKILIVIPRAAGNAPERNRLKRRIKALFYQEQLYKKEYDWIILVRKEAITISFNTLHAILLETYKTMHTPCQ